jgi:hypothetical protein
MLLKDCDRPSKVAPNSINRVSHAVLGLPQTAFLMPSSANCESTFPGIALALGPNHLKRP